MPTFREAGVDLAADGWNAFFAPAAMPADKAERLGRDIAAVLDEPALREPCAPPTWNRCRPTPPAAPRRWTPIASSGPVVRASGFTATSRKRGDMGAVQNVLLFIMADQLRADHLGCYGHPYRRRPAWTGWRRAARVPRAPSSIPGCAARRARATTGRYPSRHGATWNRVPLSVNEITLGEYLAGQGRDLALAGKTHVIRTRRAWSVLPSTARRTGHPVEGAASSSWTATTAIRARAQSGYPAFLRRHGYDSADPWTDYVIAGVDASGQVVSGWNMRNVHLPSRVAEAHSETAYMTDQALDFMKRRGGQPGCCT